MTPREVDDLEWWQAHAALGAGTEVVDDDDYGTDPVASRVAQNVALATAGAHYDPALGRIVGLPAGITDDSRAVAASLGAIRTTPAAVTVP